MYTWLTVRYLFANKGILIHNRKTIDNEKQIGETLNHGYINIVVQTTGNKSTSALHDTNIEFSTGKGNAP